MGPFKERLDCSIYIILRPCRERQVLVFFKFNKLPYLRFEDNSLYTSANERTSICRRDRIECGESCGAFKSHLINATPLQKLTWYSGFSLVCT